MRSSIMPACAAWASSSPIGAISSPTSCMTSTRKSATSPRACRPSRWRIAAAASVTRIEKTILSDPRRSVLLQETRFTALDGKLGGLFLVSAGRPAFGRPRKRTMTAWLDEFKGMPMLFRQASRLLDGSGLLDALAGALRRLRRRVRRPAGSCSSTSGCSGLMIGRSREMSY